MGPEEETPRVDAALSRALAGATGARLKECYRNSILALASCDPRLSGARYVEGYVVPADVPVPIEHGWLETAGGVVVDVTLPLTRADDETLAAGRYYAGRRWAGEAALALAVRVGSVPLWRASCASATEWGREVVATWRRATGLPR